MKSQIRRKTTRQMLDAPGAAIYVCPNMARYYYKMLARYIGRCDLLVVGPDVLKAPENNIKQSERALVIDHDVLLSPKDIIAIRVLRSEGVKVILPAAEWA